MQELRQRVSLTLWVEEVLLAGWYKDKAMGNQGASYNYSGNVDPART
jgi:hypothetical protein